MTDPFGPAARPPAPDQPPFGVPPPPPPSYGSYGSAAPMPPQGYGAPFQPYQPSQPYGASRPRRSGRAVAALVLGLCCILLFWTAIVPILALVFGLLAARDIKRSNGMLTGLGSARTGTILGVLGLLGFGAIIAVGATGGFDDDSTAIDAIDIGSCYDLPGAGASVTPEQNLVTEVTDVDCDKPHDGEAFFEGRLNPDRTTDYPGSDTAFRQAATQCSEDPFESYIGYSYGSGDLDIYVIVSDPTGWDASRGRFTCFAVELDGSKLTSSVHDIGS